MTFPAASTIFTDPGEYDLSSTQYGTMFLPQVVTAIGAALLGGSLARRFGTKRVYLAGLVANLASMALLLLSQFFTSDQPVAYGLLLGATACLGVGFGLETMNGNWAQLDMTRQVGASTTQAAIALTTFWAHGHRRPGAVLPRPAVFGQEELLAMSASPPSSGGPRWRPWPWGACRSC